MLSPQQFVDYVRTNVKTVTEHRSDRAAYDKDPQGHMEAWGFKEKSPGMWVRNDQG